MLKKLKKMYPHQSLMMVFIIGLIAIIASLVTQFVFKVQPCDMCLWQRYLLIAITIVAFIGTLFRGKIKKWFLGTISALATVALVIAVWQSLAQRNIVDLPTACAAPKNLEITNSDESNTAERAETLLVKLQDKTEMKHVDCSKPEDTLLYKKTGITLANLNAVLMLLIASFTFYKLFFKPRRRFRRYNNRNNNRNRNRNYNNKNGNNNGRRHRGSGYRRSNHRNHKNHNHNKNSNKPHNNGNNA